MHQQQLTNLSVAHHKQEGKKDRSETTSKWHTRKTIIYCFFVFLKKAYTHWVQQIKSPKVILKQMYLEYRASDPCVWFLYNSTFKSRSNWHLYKLCKNPINTNSQRDIEKKKKRRNNMMWISCYSLYYCTQYTNWSFVSALSLTPTV